VSTQPRLIRRLILGACVLLLCCILPRRAAAAETLCDSSFTNCRTPLLTLIDNEKIGIDVGFWFMEDQRYVSHLISRWNAGVPVRVLMDPRANPT